jgi:hypothetical protein
VDTYPADVLPDLKFTPEFDFDEELHIYTVSLGEVGFYGTGTTRDEATADLLDSILEYLQVYVAKVTVFSKLEPDGKLLYMLKLAQCNGDRDALKREIGLVASPYRTLAPVAGAERFKQGQIKQLLDYLQLRPIKTGGSVYVGGVGSDGTWRTCKFAYHHDEEEVTASAAKVMARSLRFRDVAEMKRFLEEKVLCGARNS